MTEDLAFNTVWSRKSETTFSREHDVLGVKVTTSILRNEHAVRNARREGEVEIVVAYKVLRRRDRHSPSCCIRISMTRIRIYNLSSCAERIRFPAPWETPERRVLELLRMALGVAEFAVVIDAASEEV